MRINGHLGTLVLGVVRSPLDMCAQISLHFSLLLWNVQPPLFRPSCVQRILAWTGQKGDYKAQGAVYVPRVGGHVKRCIM